MPNYEDFLIALNHSLTSMMPDFTPFNYEDNGMVWGYGAFRDKIVDMISSISFKEERLALAQEMAGG